MTSPLSRGQPSAEARLNGHEYASDQDQGRYDRVERRLGELEEQQSSRNAAKGGQHAEPHGAAHAAPKLTPIADDATHRAGEDPDGVGDVREHGRIAEREQGRKGNERPRSDDGVHRTGGDSGRAKSEDVKRGHRGPPEGQ